MTSLSLVRCPAGGVPVAAATSVPAASPLGGAAERSNPAGPPEERSRGAPRFARRLCRTALRGLQRIAARGLGAFHMQKSMDFHVFSCVFYIVVLTSLLNCHFSRLWVESLFFSAKSARWAVKKCPSGHHR